MSQSKKWQENLLNFFFCGFLKHSYWNSGDSNSWGIARSLTWKVRECFEDDEDELRLDVVLEVLESLGSSNVEKRNEEEVLALVQWPWFQHGQDLLSIVAQEVECWNMHLKNSGSNPGCGRAFSSHRFVQTQDWTFFRINSSWVKLLGLKYLGSWIGRPFNGF